MHPENTLKFFPTDSSWTHEVRPKKIPFEDRFPTRFAVGSLPPPNRNGRGLPTRPIEKQPKRPKGKGKDKGKGKALPGQTTIEDFLASRRPGSQNRSQGQSSSQPAAEIDAREEGEVSELFHSIVDEQPDFTETASAISSACKQKPNQAAQVQTITAVTTSSKVIPSTSATSKSGNKTSTSHKHASMTLSAVEG
jgi:hypothetical protein